MGGKWLPGDHYHRRVFGSDVAGVLGSMEVNPGEIFDDDRCVLTTCPNHHSMTTLLDYRTTLAYLAYLGYNGDTTTALKVTKPRKADRKKGKVQRNVFLCYVFGATGSGKVGGSFRRQHFDFVVLIGRAMSLFFCSRLH